MEATKNWHHIEVDRMIYVYYTHQIDNTREVVALVPTVQCAKTLSTGVPNQIWHEGGE